MLMHCNPRKGCNFRIRAEKADVEMKQKLLSSILEKKLELVDEGYRTPVFTQGFRDIFLNYNELQKRKGQSEHEKKNSSRLVLGVGLEPTRPLRATGF